MPLTDGAAAGADHGEARSGPVRILAETEVCSEMVVLGDGGEVGKRGPGDAELRYGRSEIGEKAECPAPVLPLT
ncbi:hypothetical protein ACIGDI_33915 [Streptomyces sp. NPDC085900]|uniref:hypothetical protein n=1 Tax=Streptomyces sp. NPDC085900 TaxID=3365737 RepID=UPI0037CEAB11